MFLTQFTLGPYCEVTTYGQTYFHSFLNLPKPFKEFVIVDNDPQNIITLTKKKN